jgi:hypothetical protein
MANDSTSIVFEIKQYMIIWRQEEVRDISGAQVKIRGIVRCSGDQNTPTKMDVLFLSPDSAFPAPSYNEQEKKGYMFLPIDEMFAFIDTLRYEKPIFAHIRTDRPEWTSVTTTNEPVGEGEEKG